MNQLRERPKAVSRDSLFRRRQINALDDSGLYAVARVVDHRLGQGRRDRLPLTRVKPAPEPPIRGHPHYILLGSIVSGAPICVRQRMPLKIERFSDAGRLLQPYSGARRYVNRRYAALLRLLWLKNVTSPKRLIESSFDLAVSNFAKRV